MVVTTAMPPQRQRTGCASARDGRRWGWVLQLGLPSLAFVWLYAAVLPPLLADWWQDANYSHGFFVPCLSAYFAWERRHCLGRLSRQPHWGGLLVLVGGLAMLVLGDLGAELFLMRVSMLVVLTGTIWYLLGWQYVRVLAFPLAFLGWMIPLPAIVLHSLTLPLQLLASQLATAALELIHLPVYREGNVIFLPQVTLEVVEACSGIRSLVSLLTLAVVYAYLTQRQGITRCFLVLSAIPLALVTNACRIWGTGVIAQGYGTQAAEGFYHTFAGWLVFVMALVCLVGEGWLLSLLRQRWHRFPEHAP